MTQVEVVGVIRDKHNKIIEYAVQDSTGYKLRLKPDALKHAIKSGVMQVSNYKITSDGRLVKKGQQRADREYLLMNGDTKILKFDLPLMVELQRYSSILPYGFENIADWAEDRKKFSCAKDARKFFRDIGILNNADYIEATHCVSLHDTFWLKRAGSKLRWKDVSPFRHNYSDVISTYALEGVKLEKPDKSYFSPVMSTNGSFPHTWKYCGENKIKFIKASGKYGLAGTMVGIEPFAEYFASQIAEYLGFRHVKYTLRKHIRHDGDIDIVTECPCYTNEEFGSVSAATLGLEDYEQVIDTSRNLGDVSYKTCLDMLFLDSLLMNTDRHMGNIEFIMRNSTLELVGIAPIFDNNMSMMPAFLLEGAGFYRDKYEARDHRSFEDLYRLVKKHRSYRRELEALKSCKLSLKGVKDIELDSARMRVINEFLQMQVEHLLTVDSGG